MDKVSISGNIYFNVIFFDGSYKSKLLPDYRTTEGWLSTERSSNVDEHCPMNEIAHTARNLLQSPPNHKVCWNNL